MARSTPNTPRAGGNGRPDDHAARYLRLLGPATRGVAVVPPDVADGELWRLHEAGIRGVRFMMLPAGVLPWSALEPLAARIAPLGWLVDNPAELYGFG